MISVNPKSNKWRPNNMNPIMSENATNKTQLINEHGEVVENGVPIGLVGPVGARGCMADGCRYDVILDITDVFETIMRYELSYKEKCIFDTIISDCKKTLQDFYKDLKKRVYEEHCKSCKICGSKHE